MTFISLTFFAFLFITILLYFVTPLKFRWFILLASSIVFYAWSGFENLLFVLITALIAYFFAQRISRIYTNPNKRLDQKTRKLKAKSTLFVGLFLVIAALIYAKVGERVVSSLNSILSGEHIDIDVIVPLGISYYTFGIVGYMADVYWKRTKEERNLLKLLLYMIYFPQILQGPIPRHNKLSPQLAQGHPFNYEKLCFGLQRAVWGYFKKMVIADRFAIIVNQVFNNYEGYVGFQFIVAILASAIQLYTDFSGCIDIALGISECMSIELEENFKRPFFSKSAAEFWRRWHITLGAWFKDYIYMPIVVNPKLIQFCSKFRKKFGTRFAKNIMTVIPLAVVWILTGLWHGTGIDYILWGCYWGIIIITSTIFEPEYKKLASKMHIAISSWWWQIWKMIRTFLIFCGGRLLTAPGDIKVTGEIIKRIFSEFNIWIFFDESIYKLGLDRKDFWVGMAAIALLWFISIQQEKGVKIRERIASLPLVLRWIIYYGAVFSVIIFGIYGAGHHSSSFVYMQF